jgi:serine/threonine protein kinase
VVDSTRSYWTNNSYGSTYRKVFYPKYDTIKLADFGFATDKTIDMHNTVCGSPLYMAPEIMKIFISGSNSGSNNDPLVVKNSYDSKCDLWSLGLIIYECVYKEHPYRDSLNILDLNKNIFTNIGTINNINYYNNLHCSLNSFSKFNITLS